MGTRVGNMAVGKNKGLKIGGKKGAKKKIIDPFTRKDWYDIKAPSVFKVRQVGKTLMGRTQGTKIASDGLKGRVYEVSLADLQSENDAERSFRKFKLVCEDVQGKNCRIHPETFLHWIHQEAGPVAKEDLLRTVPAGE